MPRFSLDRLGQASLLSALPVRIPGCVLWLDAGSLRLTSGDAVGTWTDLSGNGNHATQATAANKPKYLEAADFLTSTEYGTLEFTAPDLITRTVGSWVTDGYNSAGRILTVSGAATAANNGKFTIESATATVLTIVELTLADEAASTTETVKTNILNGRPVVRFDGTDVEGTLDFLVGGGPLVPRAVCAVFNYTKGSSFVDYDGLFTNSTAAGVAIFVIGVAATTSLYTAEGLTNVYVNGLAGADLSPLSSFKVFYGEDADANFVTAYQIGRTRQDGGRSWGGDVVEFISFDRVLTTAERVRLQRYLGRKYAITVS